MVRAVKIECGISFRLRDNKATTPTPITCFVEFNGKPVVKIPTGTKVLPSKWNSEKERPIGGMKGLESIEAGAIIEKLSAVKSTVENTYREHVNRFKTYPNKEIELSQNILWNIFKILNLSININAMNYIGEFVDPNFTIEVLSFLLSLSRSFN